MKKYKVIISCLFLSGAMLGASSLNVMAANSIKAEDVVSNKVQSNKYLLEDSFFYPKTLNKVNYVKLYNNIDIRPLLPKDLINNPKTEVRYMGYNVDSYATSTEIEGVYKAKVPGSFSIKVHISLPADSPYKIKGGEQNGKVKVINLRYKIDNVMEGSNRRFKIFTYPPNRIVNKDSIPSVLQVGQKGRINLIEDEKIVNPMKYELSADSSNENVVVIDDDGNWKAVNSGVATITVNYTSIDDENLKRELFKNGYYTPLIVNEIGILPVQKKVRVVPSVDKKDPFHKLYDKNYKLKVYRLYNKKSREHLYTPYVNEVNNLTKYHGWNYEGVAFVGGTDGKYVYRLYNPKLGDHHYTTDFNEIRQLTRYHGWKLENPICLSSGSKPVYRLFNPHLKVGAHVFTKSKNEVRELTSKYGWINEGVAFYSN